MKLKLLNPRFYYKEFLNLKNFVIKPVDAATHENLMFQNIWGTWSIFVIKIVATIIISVLVATIVVDPVNQTSVRWTEIYSTATIFLLSIFILPFLEEVAFRLSLRFKPMYLALTLGVLSYYFATKAIYQTKLSDIHDHFEIRLLVGVIMIFISYLILSRVGVKRRLEAFWANHFNWVFYIFCVTFAFMHIFNYELNTKHLLLLPLITLPKLVSAICYGYIRIKYGFIYSLGLHMLWNSMGFIMSLFPALGTD